MFLILWGSQESHSQTPHTQTCQYFMNKEQESQLHIAVDGCSVAAVRRRLIHASQGEKGAVVVIQRGEDHPSLRAGTGREHLSPAIHPIIIKLSL